MANWRRKLTKPLETRDGVKIRTLHEAAQFATALPIQYSSRQHWQHAAKLLMEAAEGKGSVEAASTQVERALFLDMRLEIGTAPRRPGKKNTLIR